MSDEKTTSLILSDYEFIELLNILTLYKNNCKRLFMSVVAKEQEELTDKFILTLCKNYK